MADFGYDVADYTGVDPLFDSLADLEALIADLHARDMRLLLDLVPNHTSDQHPWFIEARASRDSPRRDWYIWREPARGGGPPNTWQSEFGGSAWTLDERTSQYYFHSFLAAQPDLDWRNPQVRAAIAEVMRFWLGRGVDGFRIDVVWLLAKGAEIEPGAHAGSGGTGGDQPKVHDYIADLRAVADEFGERLLIGEIYLSPERLVAYYGKHGRGLQLPFNFQLLLLPWRADVLESAISRYESLVPEDGWPNWVLGNHDQSRLASRLGAAQARVAAVLLLTLRGTPTLYYGDEIGMVDVAIPTAAQRDPQGLRGGRTRDPARTPMRWDATPTGGFTRGTPWLPIGADLASVNVAAERADPRSLLTLYRRLLELRRAESALNVGACESMGAQGDALSFVRSDGRRRFQIVLNLASAPARYTTEHRGRVVISTHPASDGRTVGGTLELAPDEGWVIAVDD
jgi:alpha-glucosidase